MYVKHNIVACSHSNCCHGNATTYSLCDVVHINAVVKYVKVFSTATKIKQWVPFALLSIYKIFHTAISDMRVFRLSHKVPDILMILTKSGISQQIFIEDPNIKFHENSSSGGHADTCRQINE
jgi:hypothetical protein